MRYSALRVGITLTAIASLAVMTAPAASAVDVEGIRPSELTSVADGQPDLNTGIDGERFGKDETYMETLSSAAESLTSAADKIRSAIGDDADLVDFGNMTAVKTLVVYWSGSSDAAALTTIRQVAAQAGVTLIVAQRKVTRAKLSAATDRIRSKAENYKSQGFAVSTYGGFAADFDGIKVNVNAGQSKVKDPDVIQNVLKNDVGIPVEVSLGATMPYSGRYADTPPFNGGGLMVGSGGALCTSGFGVVLGSSVYRYISARHCAYSPYTTESGGYSMGSLQLAGTGNSGAAVFSAAGSPYVFDGGNSGTPTSIRTLTQRDPALSTVGTPVCQEGANSGQRCGTIAQVALNYTDTMGTVKANYVTSPTGSILAAQGDSGAPVISQHSQARAWAVGVLLGGQAPFSTGSACGLHSAGAYVCSANFFFNNVDYALGGLPGYAIRYY